MKKYFLIVFLLPFILQAQILTYYSRAWQCGDAIKDFDGNSYGTVSLGTQCWMTKNLVTCHYRDGATVPLVTLAATWSGLSTGARCYYNNDSATYKATYGGLYNWYTTQTADSLCPTGWHIPNDAQWTILTTWLSAHLYGCANPYTGTDIAKSMASIYTDCWTLDNSDNCAVGKSTPANNSSGLTMRPSGERKSDGAFNNISDYGYWWASTANDASTAWKRFLSYNTPYVVGTPTNKAYGFSVRCVKN
jgi:uncharacterized protein (TIGR02145 family)